MNYLPGYNIPSELVNKVNVDNDINVLIGENGSGKSTMLNELSKYYLGNGSQVIAVANSIYDKFNSKGSNFHIIRASTGKTLAKKTIINAFKILANDDLKRMRNIANMLNYVGFEPTIGLKIIGIHPNFHEKVVESQLSEQIKDALLYFLNRYIDQVGSSENTIRINFDKDSLADLVNSYLITMFLYEDQLKKLKLIRKIDIVLFKEGFQIPLNQGSSGELSMISTLIYLSSIISEHSVILIDEPENSLHPKWQIEYINKLVDLFYFYQPKIIIATHSPLIINGTKPSTGNIKVFKAVERNFVYQPNNMVNVEEIYENYFDLTTPENRFVSEYVVNQMNLLASNSISVEDYTKTLKEIKDNAYDERQIDTLNDLIEVGKEIANQNK